MYSCPFCGRNYEKFYVLKSHIAKSHDTKDIKCPYCSFIAHNLHGIRQHAILENDMYHKNLFYLLSRKYRNNVKKELFLAQKKISYVKLTGLRTIFQALICPFCKKLFPRLYFLRQHIITKHHSGLLKCPYCNFIANNFTDFREHLINYVVINRESKHKNLYYLLTMSYEKINNIEQFFARNYYKENIIPVVR